MNKNRLIITVAILIIAVGACVMIRSFTPGQTEKLSEEFFAMDTVMDITIYSGSEMDMPLKDIMNELRVVIYKLEGELSVTDPKSDVSRLNAADGEWVSVSDDTMELMRAALELAEDTQISDYPTFDPTLYPIVKLWGFTTGDYRIPSDVEIKKELKKVGYQNIEIGSTGDNTVRLAEGAQIDLGACAKGYLSDKLCEILRDHHVSGIISLGGNVASVGTKEDGKPFTVGITDPSDGHSIYTTVKSSDEAVVTSGDYERFFEKNGKRYHHIMDERTGAPADNDLASVTVIGSDGLTCDAYATALFVMGTDDAKKFAKTHGSYKFILILKDGNSWTS